MVETTKKILVVDDEPGIRDLLTTLLHAEGYTAITAAEGQQGLAMARNEHPDLIILDVMLPHLNGYQIARMLKFDANYTHIPIIMFTSKMEDNDQATGKEMGADAYFAKPFDTDALLAKIKEILSKELIKGE
ncbi:MAG: response regulator transcription factor [Candidatus Saganbacteria bacterium]|nr:response regulator transcription factor [Candidatus Saganbacteria bacterium]